MNERDLYIKAIGDIQRESLEMITELFMLCRSLGLYSWPEAEAHIEARHPHMTDGLREQLHAAWEMGI